MDFIGRAGSLVDNSHRVTGILLFLLVLCLIALMSLFSAYKGSQQKYIELVSAMPVYVVPGSSADVYRPESSETLVIAFVDFLTQSLYTYTYESLEGQYKEVKKFFTPEMLRFADPFFANAIKKANNLRASELFIPNRQSVRVDKQMVNGEELDIVVIRGVQQRIIKGSVVQTQPVEYTMQMRKSIITRSNPFGMMVLSMRTREIGAKAGQ